MPSQTFFNLPQTKQKIIIEKAIAEFANHSYESASISHIVSEAKIAKGSFYQYFEGKQDLYLYLVDLGIAQQKSFIENANLPKIKDGFFVYLRALFQVSIHFQLTNPELAQILFRGPHHGDIPFREEVFRRTKTVSTTFIKQRIQEAIELNQLPKYLNPDIAAFMIITIATEMRQFIPLHLQLKMNPLIKEGPEINVKTIEQIIDDFVKILEQGIGGRKD
ncbi:TetR/AcrR family transcriptional regulator [Geminocystis sp. NIES-3709]|uniref:TetR/AcrR family transcriptional regulator n=1 Tax=Geminocystis sp. NIES-3709 TaxID=1617448 RepID=UPI0005FC7026|nr:TetR/AcrR family transcriptional regulator [Geminocystis sp. NIES-3709]BAQ65875.1 transcriptional regulator [Geminocystis sp. NIES-3709]